jgi:hypothetical protein
MAINRVRQTGSAFTAWQFSGPVGTSPNFILCQQVAHKSPQPIAQPVEIHPLNYLRPTEILVPRAVSHGEITLTVMESFNKSIFDQLGLNYGTNKITDLADLFNWMMTSTDAVDANGSKIELIRVIRDPNPTGTYRKKTFVGARIVDIRDDETTTVDSTVNPLTVTVWYTKLEDTTSTLTGQSSVTDGGDLGTNSQVKDAPWGL